MLISDKTRVLSLFVLALIAIILLGAGLNGINFQSGRFFLIGERTSLENIQVTDEDLFEYDNDLAGFIAAVLVILLPVGIIMIILWPGAKKMILRIVLPLIFIAIIAPALGKIRSLGESQGLNSQDFGTGDPLPEEVSNTITVVSGAPEWLVYLTSFILVLITIAILVFVYRRYLRPKPTTLDIIAQEAINEIKAGANFKDAIIQCYYDMSIAINEQRGIQRDEAMTAREFEMRLQDHGLPHKHIVQLTRLFESVRYGSKSPNSKEESQAIAALQAIIYAAGKAT